MLNFDPYVWLAENTQSAPPPAKVANLLRRDGCLQISMAMRLPCWAGMHPTCLALIRCRAGVDLPTD